MNAPRHATKDNSFGRSATGTAARGVALLAVAVALGVILLRANPGPRGHNVSTGAAATTVGSAPQATTTTLAGALPLDTTPLLGATTTVLAAGHSPATVSVLVVNGSGVTGKAVKVLALLKPGGWNLPTPITAKSNTLNSQVLFVAGYETEARLIADKLKLKSIAISVAPVSFDAAGANVVVVVGKALARRV